VAGGVWLPSLRAGADAVGERAGAGDADDLSLLDLR